jgi:hypothetical protein
LPAFRVNPGHRSFHRVASDYATSSGGSPLLDMRRYSQLLAGASWMAEYGDPDVPEEWEFIRRYSPYHNVRDDVRYPAVFFTTTTRDDRVHPAHARKMAALLESLGQPRIPVCAARYATRDVGALPLRTAGRTPTLSGPKLNREVVG